MSLSVSSSFTNAAVVDFSTLSNTGRRRAAAQHPEAAHPDAAIIQACLNFAIAMRGASGAFEVDPTGDQDFAQAADVRLLKQAAKEQALITDSRPITWDGLRAKAAVVDMALDLDRDDMSSFLRSLAADVIRFHRATEKPTNRKVAP